jgi:hypothetical protein
LPSRPFKSQQARRREAVGGLQISMHAVAQLTKDEFESQAIRFSSSPVGAAAETCQFCGLQAMEEGWISGPIGWRAPFSRF